MSAIVRTNGPAEAVTMTSLEMVDFINEERGNDELTHANFLAKVPKVLGDGCHSFECDLPDGYGRSRRAYRFPKREACLMAMSYSYEIQARVFDRMTAKEAEAQRLREELAAVAPADPMAALRNPAALRSLLLENVEKVLQLEETVSRQSAELEEQAPAVAAHELLEGADGSMCMTAAAKSLGEPPKKFIDRLAREKWIYRRGGGKWQAYQDRLQSGHLKHRTHTYTDGDGEERMVADVMVTAKGIAHWARVYAAEKGGAA